MFEGKTYHSYEDYVEAKRSRTAGIFADSGMLAARLAIAEEMTTPGPLRAKNPHDDLAIPLPLLPRRKSSRIARTISEGINLAEFVRSDVLFGILRGLNENRTLYPPNSRMPDFRRRILIFVHKFVPTDDKLITPECFFTLGKSGKPNQYSWIMPFHVLGKCMRRYNPGQFNDVDAAVRSTVEQTILTNRMFFGGVKNWCDKRTGNLTLYNDLAQLTDPIGQIFHETLCAKITADGGDYRVIFLGEHAWEGCRDWFNDDKILNLRSIAHGSLIRNNFHNARQRDCFLRTLDAGAAFLSGKLLMPIDDAEKGTLLHIGRLSKSEEKIYDLMEKAEDLWLEKERLESIAENAIAAGAPDPNAAISATDEASSAALLAMGIAMEAQTAKELADNERDERARITSVERAAKVVERDRKRAEKAEDEEAQHAAKVVERDAYRDERARITSVERAAKVVERDRKRAEKAEEEAKEEAQRAAKVVERDAKWTAEVDASIESMLNSGVSFSKIASKLSNGLTETEIKNRWYRVLKESSGITKPLVKPGPKSSITWTVDDDASIARMRADNISFAKIASKLGNGLNRYDIKHRWNHHLKDKLQ
jgi:flagellar biosynthesis GTPase FlhF